MTLTDLLLAALFAAAFALVFDGAAKALAARIARGAARMSWPDNPERQADELEEMLKLLEKTPVGAVMLLRAAGFVRVATVLRYERDGLDGLVSLFERLLNFLMLPLSLGAALISNWMKSLMLMVGTAFLLNGFRPYSSTVAWSIMAAFFIIGTSVDFLVIRSPRRWSARFALPLAASLVLLLGALAAPTWGLCVGMKHSAHYLGETLAFSALFVYAAVFRMFLFLSAGRQAD